MYCSQTGVGIDMIFSTQQYTRISNDSSTYDKFIRPVIIYGYIHNGVHCTIQFVHHEQCQLGNSMW